MIANEPMLQQPSGRCRESRAETDRLHACAGGSLSDHARPTAAGSLEGDAARPRSAPLRAGAPLMRDDAPGMDMRGEGSRILLDDSERTRCEVWTRVMGYHRPVSAFNAGKRAEHAERRYFVERRCDKLARAAGTQTDRS